MSAPQDYDFQAPPPPPLPEAEPQAPRPTKQLWPIAIGVFAVGLILIVLADHPHCCDWRRRRRVALFSGRGVVCS